MNFQIFINSFSFQILVWPSILIIIIIIIINIIILIDPNVSSYLTKYPMYF